MGKGTNETLKNHEQEMFELSKKLGIKPQDVLGKYGMTYPNEYVAEVYAHLISGKKLSKPIMDLYYKYGGPKIGV